MKFRFSKIFRNITFTALLICLNMTANAQPAGLLYDPEPPLDSAYVRIVLASRDPAIDIMIDGRTRIEKLGAGETSEYMIIPAGKHSIAVRSTGKPATIFSTTIDVVRGKAITLAFATLRPDSTPTIFEDKTNTNKLKALLAIYHLDAKIGPLDVLTGDGSVKVFSSVAYGSSTSIQVNPISTELITTKIGDKVPQVRTALAMIQGGTYSMLLLPGEGGKLVARVVQNKIERYTGK
jgi:hypothetical protein